MPKEAIQDISKWVKKQFQSYQKSGQGSSQPEFRKELENIPDTDLQIMHDTHPSNVHIRREVNRRKGR